MSGETASSSGSAETQRQAIQQPEKAALEAFRNQIDTLTADQLKEKVKDQEIKLWEKQQVIYEILDDFKDSTIPPDLLNEINKALEKNDQLLNDEQKAALASHLKPKNMDQWMMKISLLAGAAGKAFEAMDEKSGSFMERLKQGMKWFKILFGVLTGKKYTAAEPAAPEPAPNPETAIEPPPPEARALTNLEIIENQNNAAQGYLTVQVTVSGRRENRLIKFDGSEIKKELTGQSITNETHELLNYLKTKKPQLRRVAEITEASDNAKKVKLTEAIIKHQKKENTTPTPVDISMLINDNWLYLKNDHPSYKSMTDDQRREALLSVSTQENPVITALKQRYERVRTQERNLHTAKRTVKQKLTELSSFLQEKLTSSQQKERVKSDLANGIEAARSLQTAPTVYQSAFGYANQELFSTLPFNGVPNASPYGSSHFQVIAKLSEITQLFNKQANPQRNTPERTTS